MMPDPKVTIRDGLAVIKMYNQWRVVHAQSGMHVYHKMVAGTKRAAVAMMDRLLMHVPEIDWTLSADDPKLGQTISEWRTAIRSIAGG